MNGKEMLNIINFIKKLNSIKNRKQKVLFCLQISCAIDHSHKHDHVVCKHRDKCRLS